MAEINELIISLKQNSEQTKLALDELLERKIELHKQPNPSSGEHAQLEAEIAVLSNHLKQTEEAILSVSKLNQNGETDDFYIEATRR